MYLLPPQALKIAEKAVGAGVSKMRNFLSHLTECGISIKIFVVEKTIDVDHPSDLQTAEHFLRNG
jgi:hypothetical protein